MRRAVLAAVLGLVGITTSARADSWYGPHFPYHVYYSNCPKCPYGYQQWGYGVNCRGLVFGRNGFNAHYTPANGTAPNPIYGPALGPNAMFYSAHRPAAERDWRGSMGTMRITKDVTTPPESSLGDAPYPTTDAKPEPLPKLPLPQK